MQNALVTARGKQQKRLPCFSIVFLHLKYFLRTEIRADCIEMRDTLLIGGKIFLDALNRQKQTRCTANSDPVKPHNHYYFIIK